MNISTIIGNAEQQSSITSGGLFGAVQSLLLEMGFRVSRGTYHGHAVKLPTINIDRADTPEWTGTWSAHDCGAYDEVIALIECGLDAVRKFYSDYPPNNERSVAPASGA